MKNHYLETINSITPYHILNPTKNYKLNDLMLNNKNYLSNNLSQLGYQIMNPQYISYHLEPIYSSFSTFDISKSYSYNNIPRMEIGKPIDRYINQINQEYRYKYEDSNSSINRYRNKPISEISYHNSDTQLILDAIKKLQHSEYKNSNNETLTNNITKNKNPNNYKYKYKNKEYKTNDNTEDKNSPLIKPEIVTPFIRYKKDLNKERKETETRLNLRAKESIRNIRKRILLQSRKKRNWFGLFKQFINLYIFFSSVKKYSCISSRSRNNEIYIRTNHIVNDIAILKDWIISMQDSFFDKFKNYKEFNSRLNLKTQGEKKQILKKNILNIIKLFIDNLNSNLEEIPENVQSVLNEYIRNVCYFPKKYLSKFQINRLDFNFYGGTKNLTICQYAMILSFLIINGVCVQQILLHMRDVFDEFSECDNIEGAIKNIGSILHYLVKDIFKEKQKKINDLIALFNYYRNYHLYNEQIEKLKNKVGKKINIEENDNDDEYIQLLLPYKDVKEFFDENNKCVDEFKNDMFNWSVELAKNLKNNFSENEYISTNKGKGRKIKSSLYS